VLFDEQQFDLESHMYELKSRIEKRSNFLLELIEKWRGIYQNKIIKYSETLKNIHQDVTTQFQSIDQQIQILLKFVQEILSMIRPIYLFSVQKIQIQLKRNIFSNKSKILKLNYVKKINKSTNIHINCQHIQ
jgi:hypothetical protein